MLIFLVMHLIFHMFPLLQFDQYSMHFPIHNAKTRTMADKLQKLDLQTFPPGQRMAPQSSFYD